MSKTILGKIYVGDNENVLFVINNGVSQICLMNGECDCKVLVDDNGSEKPLNFNEHHQITGIYRLRRGCEKTIYFTDNYNPPRYLNLSDVNSFKEIVATSPLLEYGALDTDKLLLQKVYDKIPKVSLEICGNGKLLSGSYNVAARYVDKDLNPSEWMQPTEPIMIWQSDATKFNEVRASSNEDVEYRKYGPTNKSIKASVMNRQCDHSYMFVQFALIAATSGTGFVNDVVYSPLIELNFNKSDGNEYDDVELIYNFTGGSDVSTGSEDEILANTEVFDKVKCIEQADNRLVMGNVTDMNVDWCKLQKYASRIVSDCVLKKVDLTDYSRTDNPKNPMVLYNNGVGYQPGEIYSFGIVYMFENGVKSPVYHIPGRSSNESAGMPLCGGNLAMQQGNNQCSNMKYSEVAMACEGFKYWGCDNRGHELDGEYIRHHRFPYKPIVEYNDGSCMEEVQQESTYLYHYNLYIGKIKGTIIKGKFKRNCEFIYVKYNMTDNSSDPQIGNNNIVDEDFEINVPLSDLDSVDKVLYPGFSHNENMGNYNYFGDVYNIRNGDFEWIPDTMKFAKRKYKKIKDLYVSKNPSVKFSSIQEWPQLVKVESGIFSFSSWVTTGGVMTAVFSQEAQTNIALAAAGAALSPLPGSPTLIAPITMLYLKYKEEVNLETENFNETEFENKTNQSIVHFKNNVLSTRNLKFKLTNIATDYQNPDDNDGSYSYKYAPNKWRDKLHLNTNITFRIERTCENISTRTTNREDYILGIKFGNIDIPDEKYLNGHKVIGYYFVQNERTADDMTVLDSAVLTPMFNENDADDFNKKMITSGRIFADDTTYNPNISNLFPNCSCDYSLDDKYKSSNDSPRPTSLIRYLSKNAIGFINPRFKFNHDELYFTRFRHIGDYELIDTRKTGNTWEHASSYSTNCDDLWITEDVQAGSSYNKKINSRKDKDDDGFDLHVFHKDSIVKFVPCNSTTYNIDRRNIHYLAPSSEITETLSMVQKSIYNVSGDNNQGIILAQNLPFNTTQLFVDEYADKIRRLPYGYLERDLEDYYADFGNRPYYVVSDLIRVDDDEKEKIEKQKVFRGDCYNSVIKYTTGMQYDIRMKKRGKKNTVWMYIAGALGVAGGVVGSIWTGGATLAIVGPSISLIQNGIRTDVAFNTMKKFSETDGKKCLTDFWAQNLVDVEQDDDEIQWLFESVDSLVFESIVNANWRVGTTINDITDYLDPYKYNPSELRQYFQKKLTYAYKDHKDGRMYRGFALAEIYDVNKDFQRRNKQKMYYCIPITYECCSECQNSFPKRIVYSQQSFAEEKTDNFKVFLPGNYTDIGGETGDITNVSYQGQDAFMVFTEEGLWQLVPSRQQNANPITQVVSFIGTGDFFNTPAQRITKNDANICFGSAHQTSFCNTPMGLFWFSEHDNAVYTFANKMPVDIFKQAGMGKFFEREGRLKTDGDWYRHYRTKYPFKDNPSSDLGTGYVLGWDNKYERLLITKKDNECSFLPECFYDSNERQRDAVLAAVDELVANGAYNICYKWNKERCCYMIDYDMRSSVIDSVTYSDDGSVIENAQINTVLYIGDVEYYYDSLKKSKCGIADLIAGIIGDSIKGNLLVVTDNATFAKISKYYDDNLMFYSTDDNNDINNLSDFIMKDWTGYFDNTENYSYIAITGNESSFDVNDNPTMTETINTLSKEHSHFNISVYPILKYKMQKFAYSTLASFMSAKGVTFADYDDSLMVDDYCYVLDIVKLGDARPYKDNVGDYRDILNSVKDEIQEIRRHIQEDEFDVGMFDDMLSLISLYNTYNYWNLLKNAYDFVHYDPFGNGNKNLLMFKDTSDSFNAFAVSYLGMDWYDENADYATLATNMANCSDTLLDAVDGIDTNAKVQTLVAGLFKELYVKYINGLESEVYGGDNLTTMKNIAAMLSPNMNSIPFGMNGETIDNSDYAIISAYIKANVPFGNKMNTCVTVHNDIYLKDFVNNEQIVGLTKDIIVSESMSGKDFSKIVSKTSTTRTGSLTSVVYTDHRIYIPNVEADIIDTDVRKLNDNSFTISYKPGVGFISFHSYMPSIYIWTPDSLFSWNYASNVIYRHNVKGSYLIFNGTRCPFVVEMCDISRAGVYGPEIMDSISLDVKSFIY
ncbi:MAG: hypothetical protein II063_10315, partial [Prevotella sp.]|nr:hypothetical protein [Prevotella sp.]